MIRTDLQVLELFHTGMIIGVLVSSPMGPAGMLCIQRTLAKGRWSGFVSSAGAALSDLIYAAVTSLFLGLIVNFVEAHQRPLQIFGSIVIAVFGCYIFRSNPVKGLQRRQDQKQSLIQDFVTAFLLTFSNVLIVFLFIGLYARFGFVLPEQAVRVTVAGLIGVFAGAMSWWFLVTFIVSLFRRWFNIRGLRVMNRIVGSVIFLLAVLGLVSSIWLIK